jgi:hypothetical protein
MMLGLAVAVLALLGASVVLGQLAMAVAAGSAAVLVVLLAGAGTADGGWSVALPAGVVCGLGSLLAVFTGSLPWFCLVPLLGIPWATRLVPQNLERRWRTASLTLVVSLPPVVLAIALAWFAAPSAS